METAQLELLTAKSIKVKQLEAEKRSALAKIESHLAQMAAFNWEELKSQAIVKAEENKRYKLSAIDVKLRSYKRQV